MLAERPESPVRPVDGVQTPRISSFPPFDESAGEDVGIWLAQNGLVLDPWQQLVLDKSLCERPDGSWAAFEVGLTVSRQNGKGSVLAARELAGLFLFGEELLIHTAHQWKTAHEAFLRLRAIIQASPDLMSRVKGFPCSPGSDAVQLKDGRRIQFIARSKSSGRGFSADLVILDEAYDLTGDQMGALLPTLSAMPNPQVWYASSAPMDHSEVLHRVRERAIRGDSARLCYLEWSAPEACEPADPEMWAQANPALGIRIDQEFIEAEIEALPLAEFGRERLGWPDKPAGAGVFGPGVWDSLYDSASSVTQTPIYALAVADDRSWACVGAAGMNADGRPHVEIGAYQRNAAWVVDWITDLASRRRVRLLIRSASEAASFIRELEARKIAVDVIPTGEYAQACGDFFDSVVERRDVVHSGQSALDLAVQMAQTRRSSDAFVWDQRNPATDISPLEAVTLAVWGLRRKPARTGRFLAF